VVDKLGWIKSQVELYSRLNLTDINIYSENFYRDLLNLLLGYNLKNINVQDLNAAAIDLGDEVLKIAIQVTSSSDVKKIKKTIAKFVEYGLGEKYSSLIVLNIASKKKYREPFIEIDGWSLDTVKDVWDVGYLLEKISDLPTEKIKVVSEFLDREITLSSRASIPKEVTTILRLIEYISDDNHPESGNGFLEEPFPDEKINRRFSDHAEDLKDNFTRLFIEYGAILKVVKDNTDLGQVKLRKAGAHLRAYSDKVLTQCDGNPKLALEKIVSHFTSILGQNQVEFDGRAVEFYIVDQLIQCNVFPNKVISCPA